MNDSDEEIDKDSELEPVDSMAGLIMGFNKLKRPELPPRDDSESILSEEIDEE